MRPYRNLLRIPYRSPRPQLRLALIFLFSAILLGALAAGWEIWSLKLSPNRIRYLSDTPVASVRLIVRTLPYGADCRGFRFWESGEGVYLWHRHAAFYVCRRPKDSFA
jgi:hypothetical protein